LLTGMENLSAIKRSAAYIFLAGFLAVNCCSRPDASNDFAEARSRMVKYQIEARGISDKDVLRAMSGVPRHLFVDSNLSSEAYRDMPLPIGRGQTISQPYIVALMTESLDLEKADRVLEIGTGSGYQAAVLAEIVDSVFTIEIIEELGVKARERLRDLGYGNIEVRIGDGYRGWPEKAPFDAIIVTCAPDDIPDPLIKQLADGGRMIIPVGESYQQLILVRKEDDSLDKKSIAPVRFVPMTGESQNK